ncbi:MAG: hypothetical protein ACRDIB_03640, partial [Ardenticatenaceae bacterium]
MNSSFARGAGALARRRSTDTSSIIAGLKELAGWGDWTVLACLLCAVLLFQPFLATGFPNTADGLLHTYRAALWRWAWNDGIFWPRWHTLLYSGYGYPLGNFAPPHFY